MGGAYRLHFYRLIGIVGITEGITKQLRYPGSIPIHGIIPIHGSRAPSGQGMSKGGGVIASGALRRAKGYYQ